jgi:uncharacterized protein DUF5670
MSRRSLERLPRLPHAIRDLKEGMMLWTIFVILLVAWLLGVVTSYTLGGFIHLLLVAAVVLAVLQVLQGRRVL